MPAGTAVGIGDDFPASQTGVGKRRTDHESAGRVDQLFEVGVQTVVLGGSVHHHLHDGTDILHSRSLQMLGADEECGDPAFLIIIGYLTLGIGQQNRTASLPEKP